MDEPLKEIYTIYSIAYLNTGKLDKAEKSKTIWEQSLIFNGPRDTLEQHATKALMARYTPNFDKEEWKYEALKTIGAEFHWEK